MSVTLKDPPDPYDVTDFRFQGMRKVKPDLLYLKLILIVW